MWLRARSPGRGVLIAAATTARHGPGGRAPMIASAVRYLVQVGALAAVYVAAAKGGLLLATVGAQVTLVWPPTGLALAALLLGGSRLWPGVALGATLANASTGVSLATACGMGMGNTLEALVAAGLLRHLGFQLSLVRLC